MEKNLNTVKDNCPYMSSESIKSTFFMNYHSEFIRHISKIQIILFINFSFLISLAFVGCIITLFSIWIEYSVR